LPTQIAQYVINEGKPPQGRNVTKTRFTMKISNSIHNIAVLDEAIFEQEYVEGPGKNVIQKLVSANATKKCSEKLGVSSSSYALAPKQRQNYA